jgi:hypothetical protein
MWSKRLSEVLSAKFELLLFEGENQMPLKSLQLVLFVMTLALITACGEQEETTAAIITAPVKLSQTAQTICFDAGGATVSCGGTGQDGDMVRGGAWTSPRFADQNNNTILDNNTGLIWTKDANAPGPTACVPATMKKWQASLDYVNCLNINDYLGFTDWRLPNVVELRSLANTSQSATSQWLIAQGFTGLQPEPYWSSSSAADGPSSAWGVDMGVGAVDGDDKSDVNYVWPVRSGQLGTSIYLLPRTGQSLCYDSTGAMMDCNGTGQDGDTLKGVVWANTRFTDLANGTIQDNLTDLIWSKDANAPGPVACNPAITKNWQASLDYVKCLNTNSYLDFSDWRLPNRNELSSLVDYAQLNQATWLTMYGFTGVQPVYYWSSSTSEDSTSDAWGVDMGDGDIDGDDKTYSQYVWPVRSVQ